jgi:hypothetical protein
MTRLLLYTTHKRTTRSEDDQFGGIHGSAVEVFIKLQLPPIADCGCMTNPFTGDDRLIISKQREWRQSRVGRALLNLVAPIGEQPQVQ